MTKKCPDQKGELRNVTIHSCRHGFLKEIPTQTQYQTGAGKEESKHADRRQLRHGMPPRAVEEKAADAKLTYRKQGRKKRRKTKPSRIKKKELIKKKGTGLKTSITVRVYNCLGKKERFQGKDGLRRRGDATFPLSIQKKLPQEEKLALGRFYKKKNWGQKRVAPSLCVLHNHERSGALDENVNTAKAKRTQVLKWMEEIREN